MYYGMQAHWIYNKVFRGTGQYQNSFKNTENECLYFL